MRPIEWSPRASRSMFDLYDGLTGWPERDSGTGQQLRTEAQQPILKYQQYDCVIERAEYPNVRTALELVDAKDGEPLTKITVNLVAERMDPDEVAVKNYSENEGMLAWAMANGIVSAPVRFAPAGFVAAPICKLLI